MLTKQFSQAVKKLKTSLFGLDYLPCRCNKHSEGLCSEYEGRPWFGCLKKVKQEDD